MPNLDKPITNITLAETYYTEICRQIPKKINFNPYMTPYLTNHLNRDEIKKVSNHKHIKAIKMYPRGATTNSDLGISNISNFYPLFEAMEKHEVILSFMVRLRTKKLMYSIEKKFL